MMDMTSDNLVEDLSQQRLGAGEGSSRVNDHCSKEHTWVSPVPDSSTDQRDDQSTRRDGTVRIGKEGSVHKLIRRVTRLLYSEDDELDPVKRKAHYRRGSILMKHLEDKKISGKATETEMKFFEMVKKRFDANLMESRTIISLSVFQTGSNPMDDPFAVIHMPVEIQQGFRRKLFSIFTLQLLAAGLLIALLSYVPAIELFFEKIFFSWHYVFMAFVIMVLALLWLYLVKYRFPLNFMVLGLYTVTQSVFFTAFDCYFRTKASIFMVSFLFGTMGIATQLCSIITKRPFDSNIQPTLISYPVVLLIAFFLGFVASLFIYFFYMMDVVSPLQFSASLASMLLLIMWFAYDASCLNERLSPDEYMQGMVFFYTDMVLFLLFLCIIFVACFACEGDCACYGTADVIPIGGHGSSDDDIDMSANADEGND